ncbi:MAG: hypothetical protein OXF49_02290 [Candidatus Saccharibacteria bacterium]|nr:hypothetical protein [Candidatus Saccharibacteria bacterium]MCY4088933.1 hypothetical protein [Candidatus Saccharibacteria bacterium]
MESWPWKKEIDNPVDLALIKADVVLGDPEFINTSAEEQALIELDQVSEDKDFYQRYLVETDNAFAIPVSFDKTKPVNITHFNEGLIFSGQLETYSAVKIGRLAIAEINVRALCLTFSSLFLLSFLGNVEQDRLLHVPAYAINDITTES